VVQARRRQPTDGRRVESQLKGEAEGFTRRDGTSLPPRPVLFPHASILGARKPHVENSVWCPPGFARQLPGLPDGDLSALLIAGAAA
jgi:hypothetical protein